MEVVDYTPKSVGTEYQSYEDWFAIGAGEQYRKSETGIIELTKYLDRNCEKPFFTIQLHDDPAAWEYKRIFGKFPLGYDPLRVDFSLFFPAWNIKLEKGLEDFIVQMKRCGHSGRSYPSYPSVRPYHSASIEYFPYSRFSYRKKQPIETGAFIAKELAQHLKEEYLPQSKKRA
jgi:hypothetical protein